MAGSQYQSAAGNRSATNKPQIETARRVHEAQETAPASATPIRAGWAVQSGENFCPTRGQSLRYWQSCFSGSKDRTLRRAVAPSPFSTPLTWTRFDIWAVNSAVE
jgi:hypothetical protein